MESMTSEQFRAMIAKPKRSKFGNVICYEDGVKFDSLVERERYRELRLLQRAGRISELKCHPRFNVRPKMVDEYGVTHPKVDYYADFQYLEGGVTVVEDVKGVETNIFKAKLKLFKQRYKDVDFRMVRKRK